MKLVILIALLLAGIGNESIKAQVPDSLTTIFSYSPDRLPPYKVDSSFVLKNIKVERITYVSTDSFIVSAFITHPVQKNKRSPLFIFNHWGEGDKTEFLEEALTFSSKGFLCLLPDGPWLCPNTPIQSFKRQGYEMYRQYVMNARKAIDLAQQQFKIDTTRIFCAGHSFGCNTAAILSGVDKRVDYFIFMAGAYRTTKSIANSTSPDFVEWRTNNKEQFSNWLLRMEPLDAALYLPYKTSPCLIQVAANDEYISGQENEEFINGTPLPKDIKKYDSKHALNNEAQKDRMKWISGKL